MLIKKSVLADETKAGDGLEQFNVEENYFVDMILWDEDDYDNVDDDENNLLLMNRVISYLVI